MIQKEGDKRTIQFVGILLLISLFLILVFQNSQEQTLHFYFWSLTLPLYILLFICVLLGVLIAMLLFYPGYRRKKQLEKTVKLLQEEIAQSEENQL
jgi:uncharacterized integral membrane protein